MLLILSARTVSEDIALHYGRLPPSFLPLGNQRLFALQAEQALGGPVAMTLPEGFEISEIDRQNIEAAGIRLIFQPTSYSLAEAIRRAVEAVAPEGPLRLLYGDTLVRPPAAPPAATDIVTVQNTTANYPWAYVTGTADGGIRFSDELPQQIDTRRVVCGDYTFADPELLIRASEAGGIVELLNAYHAERPLTPVDAAEWFDFGHLPLYFQSKKSIMIKRVFNQLAYENHLLVKQSDDTAKIRAEAAWYETLPEDLQIHTPRYLGRVERDHRAGYRMEYFYHPQLSDLAAFGTLPLTSWLEILGASFDFVDKCRAIRPDPGAPEAAPAFARHFFDEMMIRKTWDRLESYALQAGFSLDDAFTLNGRMYPPLREVVGQVIGAVPVTRVDQICFWHGDLFFGNMFYDFTARRVLTIDPRGQLRAGEISRYGDCRYDVAKLAHSVIGQYDKIILGRSTLDERGPQDLVLTIHGQSHQEQVEQIFLKECRDRYALPPGELVAMTALLFFSMLPLHRDRPDLQRQLFANGLRLSGMMEDTA